MPSVTVNVDEDLKERMEQHPEINWSEVTRKAIREKIEDLELMEELLEGSRLTEEDAEEIAELVDRKARKRLLGR